MRLSQALCQSRVVLSVCSGGFQQSQALESTSATVAARPGFIASDNSLSTVADNVSPFAAAVVANAALVLADSQTFSCAKPAARRFSCCRVARCRLPALVRAASSPSDSRVVMPIPLPCECSLIA